MRIQVIGELLEAGRDALRRWWGVRNVRLAAAAAAGVLCLSTGGWLIAGYIAAIPPDPANDDPQRVLAYFMGRHFDNLSEAERQAYLRAMMARWGSLDEEQRRLLQQQMRAQRQDDRAAFRERMAGVARDFIVSEARQYVELTPEQREQWLQGRFAMWQMMARTPMGTGGRGGDRDAGGRGGGGGGAGDAPQPELTAERQERVIGFFQGEILPRTSARDRAMVTVLMRDAGQAMRQREQSQDARQ